MLFVFVLWIVDNAIDVYLERRFTLLKWLYQINPTFSISSLCRLFFVYRYICLSLVHLQCLLRNLGFSPFDLLLLVFLFGIRHLEFGFRFGASTKIGFLQLPDIRRSNFPSFCRHHSKQQSNKLHSIQSFIPFRSKSLGWNNQQIAFQSNGSAVWPFVCPLVRPFSEFNRDISGTVFCVIAKFTIFLHLQMWNLVILCFPFSGFAAAKQMFVWVKNVPVGYGQCRKMVQRTCIETISIRKSSQHPSFRILRPFDVIPVVQFSFCLYTFRLSRT